MRLALALLGFCGLLLAQEPASPAAPKPEQILFPAGGTLRLVHSDGELTITGWDQPDMQMSVTEMPRVPMQVWREQPRDSPAPASSHISIERRVGEIVVRTLPHRGLDLRYRINLPRSAKVVIEHRSGEVHLNNLAGDIRAAVRSGTISVSVPPDAHYSVDAKTGLGDIVSEFPGQSRRRRWIFAHAFTAEAPQPASHQLNLRAGYGDIIVMKSLN
jgi:hypothetical protein